MWEVFIELSASSVPKKHSAPFEGDCYYRSVHHVLSTASQGMPRIGDAKPHMSLNWRKAGNATHDCSLQVR